MQASMMKQRISASRPAFSSPASLGRRPTTTTGRNVLCEAASLQFIKGVNEPTVPEVRLSKSRTGASGSALFVFENPSVFQASGQMGDITGKLFERGEIAGWISATYSPCAPSSTCHLDLPATLLELHPMLLTVF